jgi:hypothetical protein
MLRTSKAIVSWDDDALQFHARGFVGMKYMGAGSGLGIPNFSCSKEGKPSASREPKGKVGKQELQGSKSTILAIGPAHPI